MKRGFGSDNHSGICPEIMDAIANANKEHALAYGDDEYTLHCQQVFKQTFGEQAEVYIVFNGTGANVLAIDTMCRSHEAVICAETAHINVDECGAPQRVVGCRLLTIDTPDGKLTPELVRHRLHGFGFEHHSQPKAISITQSTELGTIYTPDEIRALANLAHEYNMYLHIDGARLANAAASLGCLLRETSADCGADIVSFGGTKNGLMMGESIVVFNEQLKVNLRYRRKQMTQLCSKMRFLSAQFIAYLTDDLWLRNAQHSNRMAQLLYNEVKDINGIRVVYPVQANSVFAQLPAEVWHKLQEYSFFYDWDEEANVVRWMCSFDTTVEDIHQFTSTLRQLMKA